SSIIAVDIQFAHEFLETRNRLSCGRTLLYNQSGPHPSVANALCQQGIGDINGPSWIGWYDLGDDFIAIRYQDDLALGSHAYILAQAIFQNFESNGLHVLKVASGSSQCQAEATPPRWVPFCRYLPVKSLLP